LITLTRQMAQRQNDLVRRCFGKRCCLPDLPVVLQTGADGLRIRTLSDRAALEFHTPEATEAEHIVVPLEALKACAGSRSEPVNVERGDANQCTFRWNDRGIPQVASFGAPELKGEFPPTPDRMQKAGEGFLAALRAAVDTVDVDSIRYATDCIRIRGDKGALEATDTRQALIQSGFTFPFEADLLVSANPVFKSALFSDKADVEVGRTENCVAFRIGAWTIHLSIDKERRFPDIEGCIPGPKANQSRMRLSESDARFLEQSLSRLPSDAVSAGAVTVDLNGSVAVRAKSPECAAPTELVLTASSRSGSQICLATDRRYLERAVRLGFREVGFVSDDAPAVCRDEHRKYIWALLSKDGTVKPAANAVRIESPQSAEPETGESIPVVAVGETRQRTPLIGRAQHSLEPATREAARKELPELDPIHQALAARDTLRSALQQNRDLLSALKQQRKQTRARKTATTHG
jgi:hypothetical protein